MQMLSVSSPPPLHSRHFLSLKTHQPHYHLISLTPNPRLLRGSNPLRISTECSEAVVMNKRRVRRIGPVCCSALLAPRNLQWICAVSSGILMFTNGTAIQKSFLVPLFALQAPASIISWIKGEYGIWTAFLAVCIRLFFRIPGELELPFMSLLMVILAPYQVLNLRGTKEGIILSLVIAVILAFQHFTRVGNLRRAFDKISILATLAVVCVVAVPCLLLT